MPCIIRYYTLRHINWLLFGILILIKKKMPTMKTKIVLPFSRDPAVKLCENLRLRDNFSLLNLD